MEFTASVIGVAAVGVQLSTTLYTYANGVSRASKDINDLAYDIALTSSVLQRVGALLQESSTSRSDIDIGNALQITSQVITSCERIFDEVRASLEKIARPDAYGSISYSMLGRLKWPLKERRMELLRKRLETYKTNLLLLIAILSSVPNELKG